MRFSMDMIVEAEVGMLIVETIAKIRRAFFVRGKSIKAICRELRVSRKVIRTEATEFRYERKAQPLPKIGPWRDKLDAQVGLSQPHPVLLSQAVEPLDRDVQHFGVGGEGDRLGLHRGADRNPRQIARA